MKLWIIAIGILLFILDFLFIDTQAPTCMFSGSGTPDTFSILLCTLFPTLFSPVSLVLLMFGVVLIIKGAYNW